MRRMNLVLGLVLAIAACSDDPLFPLAEGQGIDAGGLAQAVASARKTGTVHSLLVERHGVLVAEAYFAGHARDSLSLVWSVTKSLTSTLVGIALADGHLQSLDEPIGPYVDGLVPELPEEKRAITLRHLLTMSSGIAWRYETGLSTEYDDWMASPNQVRYYLDKPLEHPPGEHFQYSDAGAHLAGVVLQEAVGMSSLAYARSRLFDPLGFAPATWDTDKQGYSVGAAGLRIRALDMVKLGRLFLDGGLWGGKRILSEAWIAQATAPQISLDVPHRGSRTYGYFWWLYECLGGPCYRASGYAGQLIVVVPHKDLVVVATSDAACDLAEADRRWNSAFRLVEEKVLPLVR
ncbi:MAG TPA: serine hydrolase [Longimicrobiales bacterium]|nr:serine hydrolase [Longimicrobiales bacterium]